MEKGHGSREDGGAFMSNTNYQKLKFSIEHDRVVTTLNTIKL
jgi:hypothetical protein